MKSLLTSWWWYWIIGPSICIGLFVGMYYLLDWGLR